MNRFMGLIGVFLFIGLAWGFSRDRRAIHWRTVIWALGLQWALGLVVLKGGVVAEAMAFLPLPPMAGWLALCLAALPFLRRFSARRRPLPSGLRGRPGARLDRALLLAALVVALRGNLVAAGIQVARQGANNLMAFAAAEGLQLALNVAGMLVAFVALVALVNGIAWAVHPGLSLERLLGAAFRPFALAMGVPWADAGAVGGLLGKRMAVNELVAFVDLGRMPELGAKARLIATFAICGFANLSSIAIQVGGIGALAPERRGDLARLGFKAMLAGSMANALSACIAGVLY
jgi:nucleoside permease NupC